MGRRLDAAESSLAAGLPNQSVGELYFSQTYTQLLSGKTDHSDDLPLPTHDYFSSRVEGKGVVSRVSSLYIAANGVFFICDVLCHWFECGKIFAPLALKYTKQAAYSVVFLSHSFSNPLSQLFALWGTIGIDCNETSRQEKRGSDGLWQVVFFFSVSNTFCLNGRAVFAGIFTNFFSLLENSPPTASESSLR